MAMVTNADQRKWRQIFQRCRTAEKNCENRLVVRRPRTVRLVPDELNGGGRRRFRLAVAFQNLSTEKFVTSCKEN